MWKESNKPTLKVEKHGEPNSPNFSKAESMRGWLQGQINKYSRYQYPEAIQAVFILKNTLEAYNHFHPELTAEVDVESWKGESSFELIKHLDSITIVKYQRKDKESEPEEVRTEVSHGEIQAMIDSILYLNNFYMNEGIKTKDLSVEYSRRLGLNHSGWKIGNNSIFSDRNFHNKYTLILGALDSLGLVEYKGGKTKLLDNKLNIQMVLD